MLQSLTKQRISIGEDFSFLVVSNSPVAVASAAVIDAAALDASDLTLASCDEMRDCKLAIAAVSVAYSAELCAACDAASPDRVCPALHSEIDANACDCAAASRELALEAIDAATSVASGIAVVAA